MSEGVLLNDARREGGGGRREASPPRITPLAGRHAEWDAFVASQPGSTFCHLAGWERVMREALGHETLYLVAEGPDGSWRGVLPLVRVKGLLGHFLVSIPFLNDGGPLGDEAARLALVEHAVAEARRSGAKLLELRSREEQPGPARPAARKVTVLLPMPATVEELWAKTFKAKLRSQVRRPAKEGMTAASGRDQLDAFYVVFARNMRDLGTPVLPKGFFEAIAREFGDRVLFTVVRSAEGAAAAAGCCTVWGGEMEIVWASSLREFNRFSPNMLLYSTVMEEAVARGLAVFNFGRCTPGGPTHKFKLQWGGHDVPLPWPTWSAAGDAAPPTKESPAFRLATAAWSRLPMAVANRLGPLLSRQIP